MKTHPAEGHALLAAEEVTGALAGDGGVEDAGVDPQGGDETPQGGKKGILKKDEFEDHVIMLHGNDGSKVSHEYSILAALFTTVHSSVKSTMVGF